MVDFRGHVRAGDRAPGSRLVRRALLERHDEEGGLRPGGRSRASGSRLAADHLAPRALWPSTWRVPGENARRCPRRGYRDEDAGDAPGGDRDRVSRSGRCRPHDGQAAASSRRAGARSEVVPQATYSRTQPCPVFSATVVS
jgi:hypothetical protein